MNKIKIEVKEKHISEGIPSNCDFCAVALAVTEKLDEIFKGAYNLSIVEKDNNFSYRVKLTNREPIPHLKGVYKLSTEFNNEIGTESQEFFDAFIFDFDENRSVKPFNFNINFDDNTFNKMKATKKQIDILKSV